METEIIQKEQAQSAKPRKKNNRAVIAVVVLLALVVLAAVLTVILDNRAQTPAAPQTADTSRGWKLILVNRNYAIPEDYEVTLLRLSNGEEVDERIYPELQAMFDEARANGLGLFVRAGYRSQQEQQRLYDERIASYQREGYSRKRAAELTRQWVAIPGTSEHQLGIAVDINADNSVSTDDAVYSWLAKNAHRYGFILRYPADKVEITGISNEPWHFRYVGKEDAEQIYRSGLCLEEYLEQLGK